jgi:hypothetical protein
VEGFFSIRSHPSEDILEEYAFQRLTEDQTRSVEEHLLICERCQAALAELDEYRTIMKSATAAVAQSRVQKPPRDFFSSLWSSPVRRRLLWATAGAMAGLLLLAYVNLRPPPAPVAVIFLRGGQDINNAIHAPARTPLELQLADSPNSAPSYRVEVVDLSGKSVWEGSPNVVNGKLQASPAKGLPKGLYWLRLYSSHELFRELSLKAE